LRIKWHRGASNVDLYGKEAFVGPTAAKLDATYQQWAAQAARYKTRAWASYKGDVSNTSPLYERPIRSSEYFQAIVNCIEDCALLDAVHYRNYFMLL
jgi:hypothetical protein